MNLRKWSMLELVKLLIHLPEIELRFLFIVTRKSFNTTISGFTGGTKGNGPPEIKKAPSEKIKCEEM